MKLFDENFLYTPEGSQLTADARRVLEEVIRPYLIRGASIREVAHILSHAVQEVECDIIIIAHSYGKTIKEYLTEN